MAGGGLEGWGGGLGGYLVTLLLFLTVLPAFLLAEYHFYKNSKVITVDENKRKRSLVAFHHRCQRTHRQKRKNGKLREVS